MFPNIENVDFSENKDRLKIVIPVKRNWWLFGLFSLILLICLVMVIGGVVYTWQIATSGERFAFAFTVMLLLLLSMLFWFLRFVWRMWQFYATNREILFVTKETLIIRRPVSILGLTDAYDMQYVKPLFYDDQYRGAAFYYGSKPIMFGLGMGDGMLNGIITYFNGRFFPAYDDDEDE